MTELIPQWQGWLLVAALGLLSFFVGTRLFRQPGGETKESYLLGNRRVHWVATAGSIAATWLAAQALFVVATRAYTSGWPGVFWFTVPNVLSLIVMGVIAVRVRRRIPDGVTLSEVIGRSTGVSVQRTYQSVLLLGQTLQFAVQLTAGGLLVSTMTGIQHETLIVVMGAVILGYTIRSGVRATIGTDLMQILLISVVLGGLAIWFAVEAGGVVLDGLEGVDGTFTSLISGPGGMLFFSFGLTAGLGLLLGPFNDQSFWQRTWAGEEKKLRNSFLLAAALFAIAPLTVSLFGFAAAGSGMEIDPATANLAGMLGWLPSWTVAPFALTVLAAIFSTADSQLSAAASIVGHDMSRDPRKAVKRGRWGMVILTVLAVAVSLVPGNSVMALFSVFATVRMVPTGVTAMSLFSSRVLSERWTLVGLLGGLLGGVPLVAWGTFSGVTWAIFTGTLVALLLPTFGAVLGSRAPSEVSEKMSA